MKRVLLILMAAALAFPLCALANSTPVYYRGTPGFELAVEKHSGISVLHENLVIDMTAAPISYAPVASVRASYDMQNSGEARGVLMAFPLVCAPRELLADLPAIRADGTPVGYTLRFGEAPRKEADPVAMNYAYLINTDDLLAGVYTQPYEWADGTMGVAYAFDLPRSDQDYRLKVYFELPQNAALMIGGFNGLEYSENGAVALSVYVSAQDERGEVPTFFAAGEKLKLRTELEGVQGTRPPAGEAGVYAEEMSAQSYAEAGFYRCLEEFGVFPQGNRPGDDTLFALADLFCRKINDEIEKTGFCTVSDAFSLTLEEERLALLVYEIPFGKGQNRLVEVSYAMAGSMDHSMRERQYEYTYLSSPAKNWDSFGAMDITLLLPEKYPYLIESSVAFAGEGGSYSASLDGLLQGNLVFRICESQTLTEKSNSYGAILLWTIIGAAALLALGTALLVCLILWVVRRKKR